MGGGDEARVSKIYFTKNPNKKKRFFFRCVWGGGGGEGVCGCVGVWVCGWGDGGLE